MTDGPPFRAEHIGSLLRPRALKEASKKFSAGALSEAAYAEVLDRAVADAVGLQESVGLRVITDGEFRRASWMSGFFAALDGFALTEAKFVFHDAGGHDHRFSTCRAVAKIKRTGGIATDEFAQVRAKTDRVVKATLPTPSALHFFALDDCADPAVYPDLDEFWDDLVAVYQEELAALAALGARYVQLDEVPLAMLCDPAVRDQLTAAGQDPDALIARYIDVTNRALTGRPPGLCVGVHLCRGNFRSRWMASGGYEPVAERLFNDLAVDAFFLEYDTPRAGDFSPLRLMPGDKRVILGLIGTKTAALEPIDALRGRLDEAARYVPLERLALSPQCGFASVAGGNELTEDDQKRKLARVVEVADMVWG